MAEQSVPFALPVGTVIAGYEIRRVLGAGGFGITYEGYNPVTKRKAAIKEFFPQGIASRNNATQVAYSDNDRDVVAWALDRFRRSTTELSDFEHPNIVPVLNYVPAHQTGYMFMEQVEGETFEQWLRGKGDAVRYAEICEILDPVCDALEYVHAKKFIHRDIAPDNIMIRADGRPMLIDFGAIKIIAQQTQLRGTQPKTYGVAKQHYSPPEQLDSDATLDPRADVYALAAVVFRAVSGEPPVDAEKRKTGIVLRNQDPFVSVSQVARIAIPELAAQAIDRALSLKPDERQDSIAEFRAALQDHAAESQLVKAAQLQPPVPLRTPGFSAPPGAAGHTGKGGAPTALYEQSPPVAEKAAPEKQSEGTRPYAPAAKATEVAATPAPPPRRGPPPRKPAPPSPAPVKEAPQATQRAAEAAATTPRRAPPPREAIGAAQAAVPPAQAAAREASPRTSDRDASRKSASWIGFAALGAVGAIVLGVVLFSFFQNRTPVTLEQTTRQNDRTIQPRNDQPPPQQNRNNQDRAIPHDLVDVPKDTGE
ncbi:MAG TPA: serine/threonine-protein kinase [Xanthobacteraceae bacterium]|nr:serine/threonine-protein kinase [Xanthobacteraceae bacterium]